LNITLSAALQAELGQAGVWAYAVYFGAGGTNPVWTPLVTNGAVQDGGAIPVALPSPYSSGKVYILVQSQASSQPNNLESLITKESDINWNAASAYDFRFDSLEVRLDNSPYDAANLTSVNGFGLPMELSVPYNNGTTATSGYGISGGRLENDIKNINAGTTYTYTSGPLAGDFRAALSPTEAVGGGFATPPFKPSDWASYVASLEGPGAEDIVLSGEFNGAADSTGTYHKGGYFAYQLEWDSSAQVFWLVPLASSEIQGDIQLTVAQLENSIYATLGDAGIYTSTTAATPFLTMQTGANNQWGKVLTEFLTGFTAGYYNTVGKSPNAQITTPINLDSNTNWNPIYAFGQNLTTAAPNYMAYDPYSAVFFANTNSYGSAYSDALMSQYATGGPLVSVAEPGSGTSVPVLNLTIFADGETPTGYTTPQIYDYIAPAPGGYVAPAGSNNATNIVLNFASAVANNEGVVLAKTASVTLSILVSDNNDTPVWSTVTFDGATAGVNGLWQNWTISYNAATKTYNAAPTSPASAQPAGTLLINQFPTATSGVSWYQIGVGDKTFNLYTTTSGGKFENPNYAGQTGALAIDGLAGLAPQASNAATISTFSVSFSNGDSVAIDPSLLVANTSRASSLTALDAPVAGTISAGVFIALAGQNSAVANTIRTADPNIAFSWTGGNDAAGTSGWISGPTNQINPDDIARLTLTSASTTIHVIATANLEGDWQTNAITLPAGTYSVTMTDYAPSDTSFSTPLSATSDILSLTETAMCFLRGTRIATPSGAVAVEDLHIGMPVSTMHGAQKIKWIGRRSYAGACLRHAHLVRPIWLRAGAIAEGIPCRDLYVSPGHGIYLDATLVPAWRLLNGVSIIQPEVTGAVDYFHVELDTHEVIFAEACPAESFSGDSGRLAFSNAAEFCALYPQHRSPPSLPRTESGFLLEAIRQRLAASAGVMQAAPKLGPLRGFVDQAGPDDVTGWAQDIAAPEAPVSLILCLDGAPAARALANVYRPDLRATGLGSGCHGFLFARPAGFGGVIEVRRAQDGALLSHGAALSRAA
jgi:hypothetical protein